MFYRIKHMIKYIRRKQNIILYFIIYFVYTLIVDVVIIH